MNDELNQPKATEADPGDPSRAFERPSSAAASGTTAPDYQPDRPDDDDGRQKSSSFAGLSRRPSETEDDSEADFDLPREHVGDGDSADVSPVGAERAARRDPRKTLVAAAIAAAITPAVEQALSDGSAKALVVSVPSADWIEPVTDFFQERPFGKKWLCFARDGSERLRHKPAVGNGEVATALAAGRSVVGVAVAPEQVLPSTLIGAVDYRLKVKLDGRLLRRIIRDLYGEAPPRIEDAHLIHVGLDDVVAAMRPRANARDVASRIVVAAESRDRVGSADDVPNLATAIEYGAAREWGLSLARDIRDYRSGALPWSAVDRGAVFFSGPGMGKSVLARSLARACEVTLVVGSIGELFATSSGHLDGVIKSMRELFARAIAAAPSILFLDEIDGLPSRESLDPRGRDWWMPVIEDFMLQLDDATSGRREGVVVIGATNRISAVDPAILRPGRLERAIEVTAPGPDGILNILRFHVRGSLPDNELRTVVGPLEGCTPAEIMETVRSARRKARQEGRDFSIDDLRNAALPQSELPPDLLYRIAVHEAGHVVTAECCGFGRVDSVRIGGRHGAGGVTRIDPQPTELATRRWIEQRVIGLLSGRAAEIVLLGAASTGAGGSEHSDLAVATRLLAAMSWSYGLGEDGLIYLADAEAAHRELGRDPAARRRINESLKRLQERALEIISHHRAQVADIAEALIRRRFLTASNIEEILRQDRQSLKGAAPPDPPGSVL